MIYIYVDGSSKGNPGPSGIGCVAVDENGREIFSISEFIGTGTSNEAEYRAVIRSLEEALKLGIKEVILRSDSKLLVEQIKGGYRIKARNIVPLALKVFSLLKRFDKWDIELISRSENRKADKLAYMAARGREAGLPPLSGEESPGSRGQGAP